MVQILGPNVGCDWRKSTPEESTSTKKQKGQRTVLQHAAPSTGHRVAGWGEGKMERDSEAWNGAETAALMHPPGVEEGPGKEKNFWLVVRKPLAWVPPSSSSSYLALRPLSNNNNNNNCNHIVKSSDSQLCARPHASGRQWA